MKEHAYLLRELDAVGRQFEPFLTAGCVCMLVQSFVL